MVYPSVKFEPYSLFPHHPEKLNLIDRF